MNSVENKMILLKAGMIIFDTGHLDGSLDIQEPGMILCLVWFMMWGLTLAGSAVFSAMLVQRDASASVHVTSDNGCLVSR